MADQTMTINPASAGVAIGSAVLAHRRSPAQHLSEEMERGSCAGVRLKEVPFLTQIALRAAPGSPAGRGLEATLDTPLPERVGQVTEGHGDLSVLWLAPDEFLVIGRDEATELTERLGADIDGLPGQVVDVSANRTTLELSGPHARAVLDKSCQLDLHPREFPVGRAVATLLESVGVIIWRTDDATWRVMPRASFTTHVVRWLLDAMREFR